VGKIAEKAVYWSVFLTIWHCLLSAELIKTHSLLLYEGYFWKKFSRLDNFKPNIKALNILCIICTSGIP